MSLLLDMAKEFLAPHVSRLLGILPVEKLRSLMGSNLLVFPQLPQQAQSLLLDQLRPYADVLHLLDSAGLAQVIMRMVREQKPEYGFMAEHWLAMNIDDIKRRLS